MPVEASPLHVPSLLADRLAYSPEEAATVLGVSRVHVYTLMARGELASKKLGRSRRISRTEILRLLGDLPEVAHDAT